MGGLGSERGGPAQIRGCPGLLTPGQGLPSAAAHRCLSGPWGPSSSPGPLESRQLAPQVPPLAPLLTSEETMVQVPMPRQGCGGPRPPSPAQGTGASTAVGSGSGPLSPVCRRERWGPQAAGSRSPGWPEACSRPRLCVPPGPGPWTLARTVPRLRVRACPQQPMPGRPSAGTLRLGTGQGAGRQVRAPLLCFSGGVPGLCGPQDSQAGRRRGCAWRAVCLSRDHSAQAGPEAPLLPRAAPCRPGRRTALSCGPCAVPHCRASRKKKPDQALACSSAWEQARL